MENIEYDFYPMYGTYFSISDGKLEKAIRLGVKIKANLFRKDSRQYFTTLIIDPKEWKAKAKFMNHNGVPLYAAYGIEPVKVEEKKELTLF